MSKKDYIKIAEALKNIKYQLGTPQYNICVMQVSQILRKDNKQFDQAKFNEIF